MMRMYDGSTVKNGDKTNTVKEVISDDDKESSAFDTTIDKVLYEFKDIEYDEVLVNLKLIGQIKEDEKLRIHNNTLDIDTRYGQSFMRWCSSDGRYVTVEFISSLIQSAYRYSSKLLDEILTETDNRDFNHKLNNLTADLNSCLNGLEKLKITYRNDHVFRSKLEVIIDRIRVTVEKNMNRDNYA